MKTDLKKLFITSTDTEELVYFVFRLTETRVGFNQEITQKECGKLGGTLLQDAFYQPRYFRLGI